MRFAEVTDGATQNESHQSRPDPIPTRRDSVIICVQEDV